MRPITAWTAEEMQEELLHFQEVASLALPNPQKSPKLPGIEFYAGIRPYKGRVGGDHLAVVNFSEYSLRKKIKEAYEEDRDAFAKTLEKNLDRFGIMVADVSGHMLTDNTLVNYLQGAFKTGIAYELKLNGEVTPALFELLNTIFYNRMRPDMRRRPYITLIYGEVHNDGRFRYISAGHPPPLVFSNERDRIEAIDGERTKGSTPLGVFPSRYHVDLDHFEPSPLQKDTFDVNEIHLLGAGDIMLLYTDGLTEHADGRFRDERLEPLLREAKKGSAKEIYDAIVEEYVSFAPSEDDLTVAVVKKK